MQKVCKNQKNPYAYPGYIKDLANRLNITVYQVNYRLRIKDIDTLNLLTDMKQEYIQAQIEAEKKVQSILNDKINAINSKQKELESLKLNRYQNQKTEANDAN